MGENVKHLKEDEFENFIKSNKHVLVDFGAPWCGPCLMIEPIIEELAVEYEGKVAFAKVSTDENQTLAAKFGILSIPTMIIFENSQEKERLTGALPKNVLKKKIDDIIG